MNYPFFQTRYFEAPIKTYFKQADDRASVAATLQRISEIVAYAPDMDTDKIMAIKTALSQGLYRVDAERIADKLVDLDTALQRGHHWPGN